MTIRFLQQWNGYDDQDIATLSASEETRLIAAGIAQESIYAEQSKKIEYVLTPSGSASKDSDDLQKLINFLAKNDGGTIILSPGNYYFSNIELRSGVTIQGKSLPIMNFNQVCPDLGFDSVLPFKGGAVINGTGTETIFYCNTTDLSATGSTVNPLDVAVSGVTLRNLVASNVASLITCGARDHNGLAFSTLENLFGFKITGTFIDLVNPQHINGRYIKAVDCNHLLRVGAYHSACQPGNSHFSDLYNYSWSIPSGTYTGKNTDWAIKLDARLSAGGGSGGGALNYVTLNGRIQCNAFRDVSLDRTRGNSHILIDGTATTKVNACAILGTDIEGYATYGIKANYATNLTIRTDGFSGNNISVASIKISNSLQTTIQSNNLDTTLWIDGSSSVYLSGFLRYYARDNNESSGQSSAYAKGIYTVFAECTNTAEPPTYTAIKTNGVTFLQFGTSNSYNIQLSESENVLRKTLIPFANSITAQTGARTWNRWESSTVLLSGASSTQTLPVVNSNMDGVEFTFKSTDANSHTISGQSSQQIDGAATYTLAAGASVTVMAVSSGTKWVITSKG